MKIEVIQQANSSLVTVRGTVDALTAPELTNVLTNQIADGHVNLIVSLEAVDFMSSAGLRTLLGGLKESRSHGGDLRIACAGPGVDKVLKMSGFNTIAKVFASQDEAAASFSS